MVGESNGNRVIFERISPEDGDGDGDGRRDTVLDYGGGSTRLSDIPPMRYRHPARQEVADFTGLDQLVDWNAAPRYVPPRQGWIAPGVGQRPTGPLLLRVILYVANRFGK